MTSSRTRHPRAAASPSSEARAVAAPAPVRAEDGALLLLWLAVAFPLALRAALAFAPGMGLWGGSLLRFVAPVPGWILWTLAALALVPPLARRVQPALDALGDALPRHPVRAAIVWGLAGAALVASLPDRLRFLGDFLLRFGTAERALAPAGLFPQALPLDVLLHYTLPRAAGAALGLDVNVTARLLGALEAGALAALAIAFARVLGLRGAAACAAVALVTFGGYLGVFTGYAKAIAEMTVLTVAVAVLALAALRDPRARLPLGVCLALALILHRSALGLLPAAALAWAWAPRGATPTRAGRAATLAAAALPLVALAATLPRMIRTFVTMDPVHFTSGDLARQGGLFAALASPLHRADVASVVFLLSPLWLLVPVTLVTARAGGDDLRRRERLVLLALFAPWLVMLLFLHPPQGMFRDWDNFAPAGATLSLLAGWGAARTLEARPRGAWLGAPIAAGAAVPALLALLHAADLERGLARIEAWLAGPPARAIEERAKTWDFLGIRYAQLDRWDRSAQAMARAAQDAPSPRILLQWASAEQARGADRAAQAVYRRLLAAAPEERRGWYGLAFVSARLGDWEEARRAARELLRLAPGQPEATRLFEEIARRDSTDGP